MLLPPVTRPSGLKDDVLTRHLDQVVTALKAVLVFLAPFAAPDPWHLPELHVDWQHMAVAPYRPAGYTKDAMGRVHLRGQVAYTADVKDIGLIFVLPPGYRPTAYGWYVVSCDNEFAKISVDKEGRVEFVYSAALTANAVTLDGISFDVRA